MLQRYEKRAANVMKMSEEYQQGLVDFFASADKDQFFAETMVINWIPDDFSTREYADINVSFYNVFFGGKKWDGISVRFGTDKNAKKKNSWKDMNRLSYNQGSSHPAVLRNYSDGWVSDWNGHRGWSSSFPKGPRERFRKKSKEEQLLMKRLLQAMQIPLENLANFKYLLQSKDAQNWLRERLNEVGFEKIQTQKGLEYPVKVFSLPNSPHGSKLNTKRFNCSLTRTGDLLVGGGANLSVKLTENFDHRTVS